MMLLDTNILVRQIDPASPDRALAIAVVNSLIDDEVPLCIVPQSLYEFWATATRPVSANGLGMSPEECRTEIDRLRRTLVLLLDRESLVDVWLTLADVSRCMGRVSYDARLADAMKTHSVSRILTFNTADFARFPDIEVVDPRTIATTPP